MLHCWQHDPAEQITVLFEMDAPPSSLLAVHVTGHIPVHRRSGWYKIQFILDLWGGRSSHMDGVTQFRSLQRHTDANLSAIPHRIAPLIFFATMGRAQYSSTLTWQADWLTVDGGGRSLYKTQTHFHVNFLHNSSEKCKKHECPNHSKYCTANAR